MPELNATVAAEMGLHARVAAVFVRAVSESNLPVTIRKPGHREVDARSLLDVMAEDFEHGCDVVLSVADDAVSEPGLRTATQRVLSDLALLLAAASER